MNNETVINDTYSKSVIWIGRLPGTYDINHFGGKAASILRMAENNINVPPGFILSSSIFMEFWEYNRIPYNTSGYLGYNQEIQKHLLMGKFPSSLEKILEEFFCKLISAGPDYKYIVRSSALCEDTGNKSMAGFFESFIGLESFGSIKDSIKKCYASLFSDKVLHYMHENNMEMTELRMGVIIQKYIEGQPSGVIFTADTINMDTRFLYINAVDSVCADFVNGKLPSSLYIIEKNTGKIIERCIDKNSPFLSTNLLMKLNDLSMKIELLLDGCQDIEWTFANDSIHVLQSRPITTLKTTNFPIDWVSPGDKDYTWYRLLPEPLPPLIQDIIRIEVDSLSKGAYDIAVRLDTYREYAIQNNYAYVRNKQIENINEKRLILDNMLAELENQGKCVYHDTILPELIALIDSLKQFAGRKFAKEEAMEFLKLSIEYLKKSWSLHWLAAAVNVYLMKFENYFLQTFSDMQIQDFYDLIYGFSILARERNLLFSMSKIVKNCNTLREVFDSCAYDDITYERLKNKPEAQELMKLIEKYIEEFGICDTGIDHQLNPVHKLYPVVLERPDYIIGQIRNLLDLDENVFFESVKSSLQNKGKIKNTILERLDTHRQLEFLDKLTLAEKAFIANDNHNYYMERMYRGYLRLAVMEIGHLLKFESLLDKSEDIEYLYLNEIISVLSGENDHLGIIDIRKQKYEKHRRLLAPDIIGKKACDNQQNNFTNISVNIQNANETVILNGISGLRKKVTGKVYVGMPNRLDGQIILVLPHSHSGDIMPLLSKVKGLIFNWGSPYDHPGIIAREMGIPAIYRTKNAMEMLKTGDEVELDGYIGKITILKSI